MDIVDFSHLKLKLTSNVHVPPVNIVKYKIMIMGEIEEQYNADDYDEDDEEQKKQSTGIAYVDAGLIPALVEAADFEFVPEEEDEHFYHAAILFYHMTFMLFGKFVYRGGADVLDTLIQQGAMTCLFKFLAMRSLWSDADPHGVNSAFCALTYFIAAYRQLDSHHEVGLAAVIVPVGFHYFFKHGVNSPATTVIDDDTDCDAHEARKMIDIGGQLLRLCFCSLSALEESADRFPNIDDAEKDRLLMYHSRVVQALYNAMMPRHTKHVDDEIQAAMVRLLKALVTPDSFIELMNHMEMHQQEGCNCSGCA